MTAWRIRRAGPVDEAAILAADVFDGPATHAGTARFLDAGKDARDILMLAEIAGRIVGFASGTVLYHPDKAPQLFVQEVGVNEDAQRQGIARALVHAIRAEGRKQGCTSAWVLTDAENLAARALYVKAGGAETTGVVMVEWEEEDGQSSPHPMTLRHFGTSTGAAGPLCPSASRGALAAPAPGRIRWAEFRIWRRTGCPGRMSGSRRSSACGMKASRPARSPRSWAG
jgi:GNAT superfamily N-acetyltransferase